MSKISLLIQESQAELNVNNKNIQLVWWSLTGFYPSTLIYIKTMYWNACKYVLSTQL